MVRRHAGRLAAPATASALPKPASGGRAGHQSGWRERRSSSGRRSRDCRCPAACRRRVAPPAPPAFHLPPVARRPGARPRSAQASESGTGERPPVSAAAATCRAGGRGVRGDSSAYSFMSYLRSRANTPLTTGQAPRMRAARWPDRCLPRPGSRCCRSSDLRPGGAVGVRGAACCSGRLEWPTARAQAARSARASGMAITRCSGAEFVERGAGGAAGARRRRVPHPALQA